MLLYWGMFTVGYLVGAIFTFMIFAPKKPERDSDYANNAQASFAPSETRLTAIGLQKHGKNTNNVTQINGKWLTARPLLGNQELSS